MYYCYAESPYGLMTLIGDHEGLERLYFDTGEIDGIKVKAPDIMDSWEENKLFFSDVIGQLDAYFKGQLKTFNVKLNPQGTTFQKNVWQALTSIPYGYTASYLDIAKKIGNPKASRPVGAANGKNPIPVIIPCHRVIGASGKLTGFAYGLDMKTNLLALESQKDI